VNSDASLVRLPDGQLKRVLRQGDGTVPRNSAELVEGEGNPPQQHGALARMPEIIRSVRRVLTEKPQLGGQLGEGELGLDAPDLVDVGTPWAVRVTGSRNPACRVVSADEDGDGAQPQPRPTKVPLGRRDGTWTGDGPDLAPGLYRLEAWSGSGTPVSKLVLVATQQ
jgi:hypothetical protein